MIKINSEWDFGYNDTVFESKEDAIRTLSTDQNVKEICIDYNTNLNGLIAEGLISFQTILLG
jgi:hypothetical protein